MKPFIKNSALVRSLIVSSLCGVLVFACSEGDDEPGLEGTNYSISDIVGNWTAIEALFISLEPDNNGSLDIIDEGGTLKMSVQSDGKFTITISLPGEPAEVTKGKFGFEEEWLTVSYDDDPGEYDYFYIGLDANDILTLRGQGYYDFEDDGTEELTSINLVLEKD